MPAKDRLTRNGLRSLVITDHCRSVVFDVRDTRSAVATAKRFGILRNTVAVMIRRVEAKIGVILFSRKNGAGNTEWIPLENEGWKRLAEWKFVKRKPGNSSSPDAKRAALRRDWWRAQGISEPPTLEPEACEICGRQRSAMAKALHVDHCHETGKFRGWLCNKCNGAIGMLGDNAEGLRRALAYLEKAEIQPVEDKKAGLGARAGLPSPAGIGHGAVPVTVRRLYQS